MTYPEPAADNSNESETANAQLDCHTCLCGEVLFGFAPPSFLDSAPGDQ